MEGPTGAIYAVGSQPDEQGVLLEQRWRNGRSGPAAAGSLHDLCAVQIRVPTHGDQFGFRRPPETLCDIRAPLARRRAVHDLSDLVSIRHRDDVLGLPWRFSGRSTRTIARARSVDG